jgi:3-hydroxyacyl-[acyl-carrier-protein] dehydratase
MNEALASLPHGPSFRFLDEVLELDPGKSITARRVLRADEAFLKDIFPANPSFPVYS